MELATPYANRLIDRLEQEAGIILFYAPVSILKWEGGATIFDVAQYQNMADLITQFLEDRYWNTSSSPKNLLYMTLSINLRKLVNGRLIFTV